MEAPTVRLYRPMEEPTAVLPSMGATVLLEPVRAAFPAAEGAVLTEQIHDLSGGMVTDVRASGPAFDRRLRRRRRLRRSSFAPALRTGARITVAVLSLGWVVALVLFWIWLLQPQHRVSWSALALNGLLLLYLSLMPCYFVVAVNRLRRVSRKVRIPTDLRVAFVVTRAPSEPWDVARTTLEAMLAQDFPAPYDVWICDERTTDEIRAWCAGNGVRISTREDVDGYHRLTWPRRTKCKEGNLAYFYDRWGYADYDVVAQLDCDHVPAPTYLSEVVRPFADPAVGYVAAPSVCDANADVSWAVRGRLHREGTFHGPNQLGHSAGLAPVCIGSHYAVRAQALREAGGVGPELAEDFSTSFLITSAGWEGAFAIDAEAHGDGPPTFAAMLVQEFQWARSLVVVMLGLVPRHLGRFPRRVRFRFLFALSYYPLLAVTTVTGLLLAPIAAVTGSPWLDVKYGEFLLRWWAVSIWLIAIVVLLRRQGLLRPPGAPVVSWEGVLYTLTRWPLNAWGVCSAFMQMIRPRPVTFKVTPKGGGGMEEFPTRLLIPFATIVLVLSVAANYAESFTVSPGYTFLCLLGASTYAIVLLALPLLHARDAGRANRVPFVAAVVRTAVPALTLAVVCALPVVVAVARFPAYFVRTFGTTSVLDVLI
ncbi:glycosyltransferase family 2 protein [Pseudonocardia sp. NPDC046786]|uniref:glycosyltransferase family 2 protein n=1 Tax=Pseudonocardia sp. NPDC046786 TaxID=3155471 RepID=UPI0033DA4BE6